jgi:ribosome biogenesis GTPase / thiamine phosphate phosphatase
MELKDLGFDEWFVREAAGTAPPGCVPVRVTRVDRDRYLVRNGEAEVIAEPTGRLAYTVDSGAEMPCVGDWVMAQFYNDGSLAIIHEVLPRKTLLRRKSAGMKAEYQMIAANLDAAFIMQSCDANFNLRRMERYLVMVADGRVEPVIVLSKSDLVGHGEREAMLAGIRESNIPVKVILFSNTTGEGLEEIKGMLRPAKTYCLLGSSGVGKTTLLNTLLGSDEFDTQAVREKDGRGRHTTTRRQLVLVENGAMLIDTPGMRELGLMGVGESLDDTFSDVHSFGTECKFADCSHTVEPGCGILDAVQRGEVSQERYQSYLRLLRESKFHEMTYVERRLKEKQFGRMFKSAMEEVNKMTKRRLP